MVHKILPHLARIEHHWSSIDSKNFRINQHLAHRQLYDTIRNLIVNKQKLFGPNSRNVRVVHGKEEWAKLFKDGVWGGTQYMDGFFGQYKHFAKPRRIRRSDVMSHVRECQFWFVTRCEDRLEAFGGACRAANE